jgi:hypothetical protein
MRSGFLCLWLKIIGLAGGQVNEDDPPSVTTHALADKIRNGYWGLISNFDKCLLIVETWPSSLFDFASRRFAFINNRINGRLFDVPLNSLIDVSLLFLISEGIFEDFRGCQFLNQHPMLANINDNHEATEHFVWNSTSDP